MKKVFLTLCVLFFQIMFSQTKTDLYSNSLVKKELSDLDFKKAKDGYLQLANSDEYKKLEEITRKLASNKAIADAEIMLSDEKYLKWIKENLSQTKFKTIDEPVNFRKEYMKLQMKLEQDYSEVYELIERASQEQLMIILKPSFYKR